jgi:hypothetical protein
MLWLTDPTDARIVAALSRTCDLCKARIGQLCTNTIQPKQKLPGRIVHLGRLVDRRKAK